MDLAMAAPVALKAPRCPELPDVPPDGYWSETQWSVFWAIMDSVVPAIVSKSSLRDRTGQRGIPDVEYAALLKAAQTNVLETRDDQVLKAFLEDRPSTNPIFRRMITRVLCRLSPKQSNGLGTVLSSLSSSVGAFLMTGSCIPFHQQSVHTREAVIQGWRNSWFPTMRRVSKSLIRLAQICWLMDSPIFRRVTGYPETPLNWKPGADFDFKFLQFPPQPANDFDESATRKAEIPSVVIDTDVVIVGSGCGGAVAAKVLAEAGHRVLVVDKGYYFPPSMLPMPAAAAARYLFDDSVVDSVDKSIAVVTGATWGGGGTVNWSVSLQTQDFVRREWAAQGLDFFDTPEYQACMDRVCERMGVGTEKVVQTHRGNVLMYGARKMGWKADVCPQNSGGKEHSCGHCTMGCASGEKQGPAVCWLPDASAAGAEFIEGFAVDKVTFEDGEAGKQRATGIRGTWTSRDVKGGASGPIESRVVREVTIKAKRVIVACGALRSPLLLMNSGLTNPNIGRNLYLHPCNAMSGFFPEDTKPWEGAIITSYCSEFEDLDGQGHGVKLETTNMSPYTCYASMPWRSGLSLKLAALRFRHLSSFISVTRDRDTGRVYPDPVTGALQIEYTPSDFDRAHTLEGILALCKILYVMGAREIDPFIDGIEPFVREGSLEESHPTDSKSSYSVIDPVFAAWLENAKRLGGASGSMSAASAHQMGTCRMSATEEKGVVDSRGKVWDTEGLYVADSSVFPSASGVNPMVTVMAIADWIARAVDGSLRE